MHIQMSVLGWSWFWLLIAAILFFTGYVAINMRRNIICERKHTYDLPIVCVCQVNDRVGVVLRSDSDKASHDFWKPYRSGKAQYDHGGLPAYRGRYMKVEPVFVFNLESMSYNGLLHGCYVERATFEVPTRPASESETLRKAFEYFHGFPFQETSVK